MRTFGIRITLLIALACSLTACDRPDAKLRKQLIGSWTRDEANRYGSGGLITLLADGTFHSHWTNNFAKPPARLAFYGTWDVKDGFILVTSTNVDVRNTTNVPAIGKTERYQILELNPTHLVDVGDGQTNVFRRP